MRLSRGTSCDPYPIAIIGGGFSGAALALHLLTGERTGIVLHVAEPRPRLGWGTTYGDAAPSHILNVPADRMDPFRDRPGDFLAWARRRGPELGWPQVAAATGESYLPRRLYGYYIADRLAALRDRHGPDVLVHHRTRIARLERVPDGFLLVPAEGEAFFARAVVLATGYAGSRVPFPVAGAGPALIADPWAPGALAGIGVRDAVLIVGTGLSMIDMVCDLAATGHQGPVTALSRHGLLPRVHGVSRPLAPVLTEDDVRAGVVPALRRLRAILGSGQAGWRDAVDSLRPVANMLWQSLSAAEQARFERHLRPYWEVHRHRMPAESADLLFCRHARGQFSVLAGRVVRAEIEADGVRVAVRPRGAAREEWRRVGHVINCTPLASTLRDPRASLAEALLERGLARPDRSGAHYDVTAEGAVIGRDGRPVPGLYALGPARRGWGPEVTAVPHIVPQLEALSPVLSGLMRMPSDQLA